MTVTGSSTGVSSDLGARVLANLGFSRAPALDLDGLHALYRAWCERVPFDNVRKMIALRAYEPQALPGDHAEDFLSAWLEHGTGGTCWPSSNALYELVRFAGFHAERLAGNMRDLGIVNHGGVRVRLQDRDWLLDSSMLTNAPLPLGDELFLSSDPVVPAEVERDAGAHVCWFSMAPSPEPFPCRLQPDAVDHAFYSKGYEASRERGPFNQRLYARRNHPGEVRVLFGNLRISTTAAGVVSKALDRDEICRALADDIGVSRDMIERWKSSGSLEASFEPPAGPKPPPAARRPPSQR